MKRVWLGFAAVLLLLSPARAQQAPSPEANPVSNALRRLVETEGRNTVGAAQTMPADKYSFRPTPPQRSFAQLVAHITGMNYRLCSTISGADMPKTDLPKETDPKDTLVAGLKASFDYCTQTLAAVDDSKLGENVPFFGGRTASRGAVMMTFAEEFGDHYSTAAMYLRLNGLLPPTAQPRM